MNTSRLTLLCVWCCRPERGEYFTADPSMSVVLYYVCGVVGLKEVNTSRLTLLCLWCCRPESCRPERGEYFTADPSMSVVL